MTHTEFNELRPGAVIKFDRYQSYWVVVRTSTHYVMLEFLYGAGPHPWPPFGRTWTLYSDDPQLGHGDLL